MDGYDDDMPGRSSCMLGSDTVREAGERDICGNRYDWWRGCIEGERESSDGWSGNFILDRRGAQATAVRASLKSKISRSR